MRHLQDVWEELGTEAAAERAQAVGSSVRPLRHLGERVHAATECTSELIEQRRAHHRGRAEPQFVERREQVVAQVRERRMA